MSEHKYPVSEIFTSWQGEGLWAGTRMTFIRFAGCNVGKPLQNEYLMPDRPEIKNTNMGVIPIWQEECTSWDGRKFLCDTDFRVKERLTVKEILDLVPKDVEHIVLTGGEPLIHDIEKVIYAYTQRYKKLFGSQVKPIVHIETSGTKLIPEGILTRSYGSGDGLEEYIWITVSPKKDCLAEMIARANEVKLLVDDKFDEQKAEKVLWNANEECIVWLSSINGINNLDKVNMDKCKEIAERHPKWRLTQQAHKIWSVR